jgi:predicted small lipoprotein YifL
MTKTILAATVAAFALTACGDSKPPAKVPEAKTPPPTTTPATPPAKDVKK